MDIYEGIDNTQGFLLEEYGYFFPYALNNSLTYVNDIESNSFFVENVDDILKKYYDNKIKPLLKK